MSCMLELLLTDQYNPNLSKEILANTGFDLS